MQSADQVSQSEMEFTVPKARYEELRNAMHKSENLVYLIFDFTVMKDFRWFNPSYSQQEVNQ
jgi:hypothetical protein